MLSSAPVLRLLLPYFTLILVFQVSVAKRDLKSACSTCQQITDNFEKGFERTAKQNFGGGNTAWEERKLSKYETSEIRLMEILEDLCESSSFECNRMVEEHEEHFETWWFKRKAKHPDLHKWFCIETIKVCCPKGTFGPDCSACVGGSERPCHGNGLCDGDGTRGGNGRCTCDHAYTGEFCLDCVDGYFSEVRNDTFCLCADVNECSQDKSPCKDDQYCVNTEGSYSCNACDSVCSGCTDSGPDKCQACASGYQDLEGTCTDIDECAQSEAVCTKEHQECVNNDGSYDCVCSSGYEEQDGECVQAQHQDDTEDLETSEMTTSPHDEL
ncbi:cysteine-rich with EGF-like domain protein 2 isoform 2-T2 [Pholidichthys leucotaenia]